MQVVTIVNGQRLEIDTDCLNGEEYQNFSGIFEDASTGKKIVFFEGHILYDES